MSHWLRERDAPAFFFASRTLNRLLIEVDSGSQNQLETMNEMCSMSVTDASKDSYSIHALYKCWARVRAPVFPVVCVGVGVGVPSKCVRALGALSLLA